MKYMIVKIRSDPKNKNKRKIKQINRRRITMTKKTLETIKKEFEDMIQQKSIKLEKYEERIQETNNRIEELNKQLTAARLDSDVDRYDNLKRELGKETNSLEMFKINLTEIKDYPLVTREIYDNYEKEINKLAKQGEAKIIKEVQKAINGLDSMGVTHRNIIVKANELLSQLESSIGNYCEDFKYVNKDGHRYILSDRYSGMSYKPITYIDSFIDEAKETINSAAQTLSLIHISEPTRPY